MIPTAIGLAFFIALFVPLRWTWFVAVMAIVGAVWVGFILWAVDDGLGVGPAAFLLGAANAAVGAGITFGLRWIVARVRRKDRTETVES